jgi:dUTP pyrophosphatase
VDTGISIQPPPGCYGRVAPRSGLAAKYGIDVGAGVIDSDYRGIIRVILFNHNDQPFTINVGDRIAQLILEQALSVPVEQVQELSNTTRNANGFGSTG